MLDLGVSYIKITKPEHVIANFSCLESKRGGEAMDQLNNDYLVKALCEWVKSSDGYAKDFEWRANR